MRTYSGHRQPDFHVRYRFFSPAEGGRSTPPRQHTRWDFLYADDDPRRDRLYMIWPEFIDPAGSVWPEGEVPMEGDALMFIVNPDWVSQHRQRIAVGTRGFFMEGSRKVAACEVTALLGLSVQPGKTWMSYGGVNSVNGQRGCARISAGSTWPANKRWQPA
ncbi:hypothetical protein SAMN02949497_4257 [Methylomagnum ishizawai]|uniref:Uncharacterized protein n=1 Tax=Methylomagnum ishizawai TaxID=1760988 RepID=A0A1Y6D7U1_9GAMM|nr:hypothetical protein [Methylomagnum ishizawai]SMF96843.1 hypothetical protein SAMN02949497_4257 [Methylomagnum ishizawai]